MAKVRGGDKIKRIIQEHQRAQRKGVKRSEVGYFPSAQYPDGTPAAMVALIHEYGIGVPERPFAWRAGRKVERWLKDTTRRALRGKPMAVNEQLADKLGRGLADAWKAQIDNIKMPANAPATLARKQGENPLIDTRWLRNSVKHKNVR